jgi:hypothetical protein
LVQQLFKKNTHEAKSLDPETKDEMKLYSKPEFCSFKAYAFVKVNIKWA